MKSLREALVHKYTNNHRGPKEFLEPGAILQQRNEFCWYFDGEQISFICNDVGDNFQDINTFLKCHDDDLVNVTSPYFRDYDIIKIYQSKNSISKPTYENVNKFVKTHKPVWVSKS